MALLSVSFLWEQGGGRRWGSSPLEVEIQALPVLGAASLRSMWVVILLFLSEEKKMCSG